LKPHLSPASHVIIPPMNPWSGNYLQVFLYTQGIPFFQMGPIYPYFGGGKLLGEGRPPWNPDVRIDVGRGQLAVFYADGRKPVILASRRSLR
jgi:hypothetical protein